jgi:hypothetical protein
VTAFQPSDGGTAFKPTGLPSVGQHSTIPPIPAAPDHTKYFPAGAVTLALELRVLDEAVVTEAFSEDFRATAGLAEFDDLGALNDGGPSVHVYDATTDDELIRFDCFDQHPHYHYIFPGDHHMNVAFDTAAHGDMLPWVLSRLRSGRLGTMLENTAVPTLGSQIEQGKIDAAVEQIEEALSHRP